MVNSITTFMVIASFLNVIDIFLARKQGGLIWCDNSGLFEKNKNERSIRLLLYFGYPFIKKKVIII